jgi:hypothetical protein
VKIPAGTYQTHVIKRRPQVQLEVVQGAYDGCRLTIGVLALPPRVIKMEYTTFEDAEVEYWSFMPPREE